MIKNLTVYNSKQFKLNKAEIHRIISTLQKELNFRIEFMEVNIITSEEIHQINNQYLQHNYSTDIITFNYSGENNTLDGEIFISLDDAYYNSLKYKVNLDNELLRLIIHGFLHLVGYDDKVTNDKRKMKRIENKLVKQIEGSIKKIILKYECEDC
jgi:rRNA maturation RNase YbeY